jgi:hypothetical protein
MATVNIVRAQTEVSIKVGANYSNIILKGRTENRNATQFKPGFQIGLSVDVPVGGEFYIQPELRYSRKGYEQENSWFAGSGNNFRVTANYFELPVSFLYKPSIGKGNLLLGAGPYLGYGTGGKWKSDEPVVIGDVVHHDHGDIIFDNDASNGGGDNSYLYGKSLDYGANFLVGYEFFNKISVQFNFQLGLANLQPEYSDGTKRDDTLKNMGFGISLGYKL